MYSSEYRFIIMNPMQNVNEKMRERAAASALKPGASRPGPRVTFCVNKKSPKNHLNLAV